MSLWSRVSNVFRKDRASSEIEEELRFHIDEAIAEGRDPEEARRAFGPAIRHLDDSRDIKLAAWAESLLADLVFGARQLAKHRTQTAAAVLSLALTTGACTAAFRLIDAALLRTLPVAGAGNLFVAQYEFQNQHGRPDIGDIFEYPTFRKLRQAASTDAIVMAIGPATSSKIRLDGADVEERVKRQYVSGTMFDTFGLRPALGRLLTLADDSKPGAHPYAVLSHEYWTRRFAGDPAVTGKTFQLGGTVFEIIGVAPEGFTGTAPGTFTDIFIPTMMNAAAIEARDWGWFHTWVKVAPGANPEIVRAKLAAAFSLDRRERTRTWTDISQSRIENYVSARFTLRPAAAGFSGLQRDYHSAMTILAALVALLLLIACANIANLMLARATARAREMALRVSIGAGRSRLIRMVMAECALLAILSSLLGALFARWAAPFVASMINPPDDPVRLVLDSGARVFGFVVLLTAGAVFVFGIAPALRASSVRPAAVLRGGNTRARGGLMRAMLAGQTALCLIVILFATLFVSTLERLRSDPPGFSAERLLAVEAKSQGGRPDAAWESVEQRVRQLPGVESAALCSWALLSGSTWIFGMRLDASSEWERSPPYLLGVAPGWFETMRIPLLGGRGFNAGETAPDVAVVNQAFAKRYFNGENPAGRSFQRSREGGAPSVVTIVGWVGDAKYLNLREQIRPTVYTPFRSIPAKNEKQVKEWSTIMVRTRTADPMSLSSELRDAIPAAAPGFRMVNLSSQQEFINAQMLRERMLATLSLFFAVVAVALAGVGLYGVLNYVVRGRWRDIGIRIALGARPRRVAAELASPVALPLVIGAIAGIAVGLSLEHYLSALLYRVKVAEASVLIPVAGAIMVIAIAAAIAPIARAIRLDPVRALRQD